MNRCVLLAPALDHGDALSHFAVLCAEALRGAGWESEIRAPIVHPKMKTHARATKSPPRNLTTDDLLILVHSNTSPWLEAFEDSKARRMLLYTGITPPALCEPHAPHLGMRLRQAIDQLRDIAPLVERAICTSQTAATELREHTEGLVKASVVPLVIDESLYPTDTEPRAVGDPPRLLAVGRVVPHKRVGEILNVHIALRATFHPETRLDIVGDHSLCPELTADLRKFNPDATFHGKVGFSKLINLYQQADALLMTSGHEGFGVPLLEAMWMGVPVIARQCDGTAETLGDAGLLLQGGHRHATAALLEMVWTDENLRQTLIAKGRERAKKFAKATLRENLVNAIRQ